MAKSDSSGLIQILVIGAVVSPSSTISARTPKVPARICACFSLLNADEAALKSSSAVMIVPAKSCKVLGPYFPKAFKNLIEFLILASSASKGGTMRSVYRTFGRAILREGNPAFLGLRGGGGADERWGRHRDHQQHDAPGRVSWHRFLCRNHLRAHYSCGLVFDGTVDETVNTLFYLPIAKSEVALGLFPLDFPAVGTGGNGGNTGN
jgi:hypothetical protein